MRKERLRSASITEILNILIGQKSNSCQPVQPQGQVTILCPTKLCGVWHLCLETPSNRKLPREHRSSFPPWTRDSHYNNV